MLRVGRDGSEVVLRWCWAEAGSSSSYRLMVDGVLVIIVLVPDEHAAMDQQY
jgi:hypothetical protein